MSAGDPPPVSIETIAPVSAPQPPAQVPEENGLPWLWIALALAALGLSELARRWFWPKAALSCEIAAGPSEPVAGTKAEIGLPEVAIDIRIETGEASAPIGNPFFAEGETA